MVNYFNDAFFRKCVVVLLITLFVCFRRTYGCNFPTEIVHTWHDSQQGTTTFGTTSITGLTADFGIYGQITEWDCREETFSTNGRVLLKSKTTVTILFQPWYVHICLEFVPVTTYSYMYYRKNGEEENAQGARLKSTSVSADDTVTISSACDDANGATGAEFAMLVRSGSETDAYQQCPDPLLGRFDFNITDSGGSTHCDVTDPNEHLNVCTDKTQLAFDVACAQSPVYAPGSVYCVGSVESGGTTYVALFNPGSYDDSTTYQFSCLAISSDSLSATIVYGNCTNQMSSSVVAIDRDGTTIGQTITFAPYVFCQGGCTWPSPFVSSMWRDNTRGTLTFGTDTLTGFSMTIAGTTINNWECLDKSFYASESILMIKATDTFVVVGSTWITYLCLDMTEVSTNSFTYYQKADQDEKGGYERAVFSNDGTLTAKASICAGTSVPTEEFHFMVKQGEEEASIQECASSLLSRFDYTVTTSAVSPVVTCDTSTDDWDVCNNTSKMRFDYTTCATQMAYSAAGLVYCMVTVTANGHDYSVVYNTDSSPTYQFTCIVSSSDAASFVYNNCTVGQTPTGFAKQPDGTNIGYKTTMTQTESCLQTTSTTTTTSTTPTTTSVSTPSTSSGGGGTTSGGGGGGGATNTGASTPEEGGGSIIPMVVGAVVGLLLIILILFLIYWFCYRKKKFCFEKKEVGHSDNNITSTTGGPVPVIDDKKPGQNGTGPTVVPDMSVPLPSNVLPPLPSNARAAASNTVTTPRTLPSIQN